MEPALSEKQINQFKRQLQQRFDELRAEMRQKLLDSDNEQYVRLTSGVNDTGDQSVADLLADLDLAIIDQHVNEIRAVEAALLRIAEGTYGYCIDDQEPIEYARLQANPEVKRCYGCQVKYEETFVQPGQPTL